MTEIAVWSNLDFEYELAEGSDFRSSPQLQKLCKRWEAILRLLPGCEGALLGPRQGTRLIPWGVTPSVIQAAGGQAFPDPELVKRLNDKRFSHQLERELDCLIPGACVVESLSQLDEAVAGCTGDWVLKHPLGVGGRERVTGKHGKGYPQAGSWAAERFKEGWTLVFEPWIYERKELSFHFEIEEPGPRFLGQCDLVSDASGAFRGNIVRAGDQRDEELLETVRAAMTRVWNTDYRGPVSVDSFRGERGEARPIMEINARYSFGRLALELHNRIPEGWTLFWWHPKARERAEAEAGALEFPEDVWEPGLYRLPKFAEPARSTESFLKLSDRVS